jgi:hypothetical protein
LSGLNMVRDMVSVLCRVVISAMVSPVLCMC